MLSFDPSIFEIEFENAAGSLAFRFFLLVRLGLEDRSSCEPSSDEESELELASRHEDNGDDTSLGEGERSYEGAGESSTLQSANETGAKSSLEDGEGEGLE